jgi:hypothetical protein
LFIVSSPSGHATPTLAKSLCHVLLYHPGRHLQALGDLLLAQTMYVLQHDRRVAFRWQSAQHDA